LACANSRQSEAIERVAVRALARSTNWPPLGWVNCLKGREGDRINAVLATAGYNFSLLLRRLAELLRALIRLIADARPIAIAA
jgi:hypothetical protein